MADLPFIQTAAPVIIVGSDSTGTETNAVNATANGLQVDGSAVTQPISAVSLPLPTGASTSANQTNGSQKSQIVNPSGTSADIKALNVQVTATDNGLITNAVLHGLTTAGGGTYVDVKVNPSGALTVDATQSGTWTVQQGTPPWSTVGNVASGASDSGNPIKVGGVFNTTPPTFTTGQRGDIQISSRGSITVAGSSAIGSAPLNNPVFIAGYDGTLKRAILTDTSGNSQVVGNVASAASDSGNPIKVGMKYNSTPILVTNGQRADMQSTENAELIVSNNYASYTPVNKVWSVTNLFTLTVGTTETPILLFKNPNASGIKVRFIKAIFTGASSFYMYSNPTITTNGTALTPTNMRIKTSPVAAASTPFQSPTISANGTGIHWFSVSSQAGSFIHEMTHMPILEANNNLLITAKAGANNTPVAACLIFMEVQ